MFPTGVNAVALIGNERVCRCVVSARASKHGFCQSVPSFYSVRASTTLRAMPMCVRRSLRSTGTVAVFRRQLKTDIIRLYYMPCKLHWLLFKFL